MWWLRKQEGKLLHISIFLAKAREKGEIYPRPWCLELYKKRLKWYLDIKRRQERREHNEKVKNSYRLKGPKK